MLFNQMLGLKIVLLLVAALAIVFWWVYERSDTALEELGQVDMHDQRRMLEIEAEEARRWK